MQTVAELPSDKTPGKGEGYSLVRQRGGMEERRSEWGVKVEAMGELSTKHCDRGKFLFWALWFGTFGLVEKALYFLTFQQFSM